MRSVPACPKSAAERLYFGRRFSRRALEELPMASVEGLLTAVAIVGKLINQRGLRRLIRFLAAHDLQIGSAYKVQSSGHAIHVAAVFCHLHPHLTRLQ